VDVVTPSSLGTETYVIPLMFTSPPLRSNGRQHWTYRARITRELHEQVGWQLIKLKVPALTRPTFTLHWQPATNRRRDSDGPVPTSKAYLDALVVHKILPDDTPEHVTHMMPVIEPVAKPARLWLELAPPAVPLGVHDEH
jgi:crossover junction endodeoxyribonuclease RusA